MAPSCGRRKDCMLVTCGSHPRRCNAWRMLLIIIPIHISGSFTSNKTLQYRLSQNMSLLPIGCQWRSPARDNLTILTWQTLTPWALYFTRLSIVFVSIVQLALSCTVHHFSGKCLLCYTFQWHKFEARWSVCQRESVFKTCLEAIIILLMEQIPLTAGLLNTVYFFILIFKKILQILKKHENCGRSWRKLHKYIWMFTGNVSLPICLYSPRRGLLFITRLMANNEQMIANTRWRMRV